MQIEDIINLNETIVEADKNEKKNILRYLKKFEKYYKLANIQKIEEEYYKGMFCGTEYKYHYIVELHGGDNDKSDWNKYLYNLFYIFDKFDYANYKIKDAWIIMLINDEYHDKHTVFVGFRI